MINPMDKEELIHVILRFRGAEEYFLIEQPLEDGKTMMDEIIPAAKRAASLAQIHSKEMESFLQIYIMKMLTVITRLCQLILYITAQNADISERACQERRATD